jgi:hypothetical protein
MRPAISPRLAMKTARIGVMASPGWGFRPAVEVRGSKNASIASLATRQRPPTRRAGSRPLAIQRWTERVLAPIRAAASLGLSSSVIVVAIVA